MCLTHKGEHTQIGAPRVSQVDTGENQEYEKHKQGKANAQAENAQEMHKGQKGFRDTTREQTKGTEETRNKARNKQRHKDM